MKNPFKQEKNWNKTVLASERIAAKRKLETPITSLLGRYVPGLERLSPEMFDSRSRYLSRPIIGRDSKIDGGVYLGESEREALVVDWERSPNIQKLYNTILNGALDWDEYRQSGKMIYRKSDEDGKKGLISVAYDVVTSHMNGRNPDMTESYIYEKGWLMDKKVNLDHFVEDRIGVCRHRALVLGVILERMIKEGLLSGKVSVDRNTAEYRRGYGGHAWVRYTTSSGKVIILDPMHRYKGSLENVKRERANGNRVWDYLRPKD